jgi:hypothetical protein
MNDIQRFTADANHAYRDDVFGTYVLYADHVAALAQAIEHRDALHATSNGMAYAAGQRDALAGLDNDQVWFRIMAVLDRNGINSCDSCIHSWRCFDKERYPEPCACAAEVVVEIIQAVKGDAPTEPASNLE